MFKDINGFEDYKINEYGEVISKERVITDSIGHTYILKERKLKPYINKKGYLRVDLMKDKKRYPKYVHVLVAENFINNDDTSKIIVNHKDGNKQNCYYENLEWSTYSHNNQHAYDNKLKARGSDFYNSKLNEQKVQEIKSIDKSNYTYQQIADMYNVSRATIRDIFVNKTWKHV